MKLTVFQSDKGDCLLIEGKGPTYLLVDGGMRSSFSQHVAPVLRGATGGAPLDLVYVSHIDSDHISGILQLMDDTVAWRVHSYRVQRNDPPNPAPPNSPAPPDVREIWHNAFHELVGENAGPISDMLAAIASVLSASDDEEIKLGAAGYAELVTSTKEAIQLSRRVGDAQLGIPLNRAFGGKLAMARPAQQPVTVGQMSITVVGPFEEDLDKLRQEWNEWLDDNRKALLEIARRAREDEERLHANAIDRLIVPAVALANELGDRKNVTTPNLASLMLLVEEDGRKVLLTGDGHADDILKGLEGRLEGGRLHVDVLKVQHHGSEHNIHEDFCNKVTADHYIFCGNGAHNNPDLAVVDLIARARLAAAPQPFTFWFNSSSAASDKQTNKDHMAKVEDLVSNLALASGGTMEYRFLTAGSSIELSLQ
ncbi:MAG: MBL fold metallo-hydrolase [Acidobacteriota bacterium]